MQIKLMLAQQIRRIKNEQLDEIKIMIDKEINRRNLEFEKPKGEINGNK